MDNRMQFGGGRILPPAIKMIIIINVIMFFLTYLMNAYHFGDVSISGFLYQYCALFPLGDYAGMPSFYPWQLITYQFMHANFQHIFFNLFSLWMFGSELEAEWGSRKFVTFYLLAGIGAGIAQLFVSPLIGAIGPTVGASGAIYGVLIAYALTNPDRKVMFFPIFIPIKARTMIIGMIIFDLVMGFTDSGNVAHFAHLGGAAAGYLLIKFGDRAGIYTFLSGVKRAPKVQYSSENSYSAPVYQMNWQKPEQEPTVRKSDPNFSINIHGEEITQKKVDAILDKISASGYTSLTENEKKVLFELSKKMN